MSLRSDTITRSGRVILGATSASVVLLLGAWLLLRPGAPAPDEPAPAPATLAGGVEAAAVDPARWNLGDDRGDDLVAIAPLPVDATVEDRLAAVADRPPVLPDPALLTAQETFAAALPVATAALEDEVASRRSALRRACWKKGGPASATFFITTTFTADGTLSDHSVSDDGAGPGVADCVRAQLSSLKIHGPGVEVMTRARLELP